MVKEDGIVGLVVCEEVEGWKVRVFLKSNMVVEMIL